MPITTTFTPSSVLQPFVKAFAISQRLKAGDYKVFPDTCIVMGFQYSGKHSYIDDGQSILLGSAWITGLNDTYRIFHNSAETNTLFVIFSETGAGAFFKYSMHLLFGQCLPLDNFISGAKVDSTIAQLTKARTDTARLKVIENFLISRLNKKVKIDPIGIAIDLIKQGAGNTKIRLLAEKLKMSQCQFEKRFRKIVGASPKTFSSIVRLRKLINAAPNDYNMTRLGLEAGFSDQAHFIRAFKLYTGITPKQYFKEK